MSNVISIGKVTWSRQDMIEKLEEFASLYEQRPIKDNTGGMKSPHMFLAWFVLQALKPKAIVESGVWLGQGTWFFEQACPNAQLYCIDLNLNQIRYKSNRAKYFDRDFSTLYWNDLPKQETLLFFDDHQNAYEQVKTAKWFGFKHILFEDNYPPSQGGDCYSLKKVFMNANYEYTPTSTLSLKTKFRMRIDKLLGMHSNGTNQTSNSDVYAKYLKQNLEVYHELPPIFRVERTRWNDVWDDEKYPTPEPLLSSVEKDYHQLFFDEAMDYTWMCYVKLK